MGDLRQDTSRLKKTLALLYEATRDLAVLNHGKSLFFQALDHLSPIKMATALFMACQPISDSVNEDFNVLAIGSFRYSPTA